MFKQLNTLFYQSMTIPQIPDINQCIEIGTISRPHGKDGAVMLSTKNLSLDKYKTLKFVFFCLQNRLVPFHIESVTVKSNSVIIKFEDIQSMEKAELYCSTKLYIEQTDIEDNGESEDDEIIGYTIINDENEERIGTVQEVMNYSSNVVLDIRRNDGTAVLIPFADDLVRQINDETKTIVMTIPDGILDI